MEQKKSLKEVQLTLSEYVVGSIWFPSWLTLAVECSRRSGPFWWKGLLPWQPEMVVYWLVVLILG